MPASLLIAASAAILLFLGALHLVFTFYGTRLHPRDPALIERMREAPLVLTRETTMWKTWIGFNASHSMSAMLFGLIYGYLALLEPAFLLHSNFLLTLGAVTLAMYLWLGKRYWFSVPFRGIALASTLYAVALLVRLR